MYGLIWDMMLSICGFSSGDKSADLFGPVWVRTSDYCLVSMLPGEASASDSQAWKQTLA